MPLTPKRRIGVFEIEAPIGAGGMGEVYRARDTRLGRDVAIKILPHAFTTDPDRLARFDREARVLASLNHPNIATIHGVEEADGVKALVLELVPGDTLAERIASVRTGGLRVADDVTKDGRRFIVNRNVPPSSVGPLDILLNATAGEAPGPPVSPATK